MVFGAISGREYLEDDIFDPRMYPRMKEEPLINNDDCLVVPVRNGKAPHFRRIGSPSFGKRLGRDENNPTHDDCVRFIFNELRNEFVDSVKFSTYVFNDERRHEEQVIFSPVKGSEYVWFMEDDCRLAFGDETYIKPDLAGRDSSRFSPRAAFPNVVLEVIRTHIPDKSTFEKLVELSKCNYHVYFYFVAEGRDRSKFNHLKEVGGVLTIRVSHYLIGGRLFRNGKEFYRQRSGETFEAWYGYLKNSYFKGAKERA